jgi:hypothetical protein
MGEQEGRLAGSSDLPVMTWELLLNTVSKAQIMDFSALQFMEGNPFV